MTLPPNEPPLATVTVPALVVLPTIDPPLGSEIPPAFTVVVPVDGMSSDDVFPELYTTWHLSTAARIADKVTLTKTDMVSF